MHLVVIIKRTNKDVVRVEGEMSTRRFTGPPSGGIQEDELKETPITHPSPSSLSRKSSSEATPASLQR